MGFWGYDQHTKEGFLVTVPDRSRTTILPIIKRQIRIGTTIVSDEARIYNSLEQEGYSHLTVNHSRGEWINRETGATTNHVEAYWGRAKDSNKSRKGTHRTTLESHLECYMWRNKFKEDFFSFIEHVKEFYPIN